MRRRFPSEPARRTPKGRAVERRPPRPGDSSASAVATPIGPSIHPLLPKRCPQCDGRFPGDFKVCPHDAVPLEDPEDEEHDPLIGFTLADSYRIVRLIGEGGMGRVYEARHTRLRNKRFAIKVLVEEYAHQPEVVARFEREAELSSQIAHPNVVGVYDVHRLPDGRPCIVGEYLEGQEFGALLEDVGRLDAPTAVRIVRQVCLALNAAHACGVVHRDMKPENVFLIGDPTAPLVKVLDFGISKQDGGRANLTRTGTVMGTPAYMAPEQARGQKVDHRADVYSVGAILYRATTGAPPFAGEDGAQVLTQVLTQEPPRPRDVYPALSESVELVIQRAMAPSPAGRYDTMLDFEAELAELDPHGPLPRASSTLLTPLSAVAVIDSGAASEQQPTQLVANGKLTLRATHTARVVKSARPALVLLSVLACLWVAAGLVAMSVDLLRHLRGDGGTVTPTEVTLIVVLMVVASATPLFLWVRYLKHNVWHNTPRCLALREILSSALVVSLCCYGLLAVGVVLAEAAVRRMPLGSASGLGGGLLFVPALLLGLISGWAKSRQLRAVP
ncbi:MAG: serine/threonine protein kinase [Polyangiaceae bacterium]|nr:serine/threonine protein kinase [Polyangiaceae bacterium]